MKPFLYPDIETIPDYSRIGKFTKLKTPEKLSPRSPCKVPVGEIATASVDGIVRFLEASNPCHEWVEALRTHEAISPKPRVSLLEKLDKFDKREADNAAEWGQWRKTLATTPEYNRIVSLAYIGETELCEVAPNEAAEKLLLQQFWWRVSAGRQEDWPTIVGMNSAFDIRTICVRSALLGVKSTRVFDFTPWKGDVLDLGYMRFGGRPESGFSLDYLCDLMGYPETDDIDGSQIEDAFNRGDWAAIEKHNLEDVRRAKWLHERYAGFFCATLS